MPNDFHEEEESIYLTDNDIYERIKNTFIHLSLRDKMLILLVVQQEIIWNGIKKESVHKEQQIKSIKDYSSIQNKITSGEDR